VIIWLGLVLLDSVSASPLITIVQCVLPQTQKPKKVLVRSADIYNTDVEALTTLAPGTHSHGVKAPCCLNNIEGFHVTQNFSIDPMHILLEGVVPYELGCILYCLVNEKHFITVADVNMRLSMFFNKNTVDRHNRPPHLHWVETPE